MQKSILKKVMETEVRRILKEIPDSLLKPLENKSIKG